MGHLTPRQAALRLRLTPAAIRIWCRKHRVGVRVGGRWRIPISAIDLIERGTPLPKVASRVR